MNRQDAIVLEILEGGKVSVFPMLSSACSSCQQKCSKAKNSFIVKNPKQLPIQKGNVIKIRTSSKLQILQSIYSLFIPILCAIFVYFCNRKAEEGTKSLLALFSLFASAFLLHLFSHKMQKFQDKFIYPEITEIIKNYL